MTLKSLFEYRSYKSYVSDYLEAQPQKGRGQYRRIAQHLRMHTTLVSQVFRGTRHLSLEQAAGLSEYLGLGDLETDYFIGLVELDRSGSAPLSRSLDRRLQRLRGQALDLKNRLSQGHELSEADRARFYSSWIFSAVRLLSSLEGKKNAATISNALNLPQELVVETLDFLLTRGLCVKNANGEVEMGPSRIHVDAQSPFVNQHHRNWRLRAMADYEKHFPRLSPVAREDDPMIFTAPITLSRDGYRQVRHVLLAAIDEVSKIVSSSPSECLTTLTIDWMKIAE